MKRLDTVLKDRVLMRYSLFILFTATLLYVIYLVLSNLSTIFGTFGMALASLAAALSPLLIGVVIAYLINPLTDLVERQLGRRMIKPSLDPEKEKKRKPRRRAMSVLFSYIFVIVVFILFLYGIAAMLIGSIALDISPDEIYDNVLGALVSYGDRVSEWATTFSGGFFGQRIEDLTQGMLQWVTENLNVAAAINFVTSIGFSVVNFVIGLIISIYLSIDKEFLIGLWHKLLDLIISDNVHGKINYFLREVNRVVGKFTQGVLLDALIVGTLSAVSLTVYGLEFALFVGVFAGVLNIIPYFGPFLGMIPAFFIGLFTEGFWKGAFAVLILLIVQQFDANLIYPRIVGSTVGVRPLFVLLAVLVGGYYGGLLGMILAVPIAGVLQILILNIVALRKSALERKGQASAQQEGIEKGAG